MTSSRLALRSLQPTDDIPFKSAIAEFKTEALPFQFVLGYDESIPFTAWIEKLKMWPSGEGLPNVPNTFLVGVVDGKIVGRVSIRHYLDDFLRKVGGHVGYGVVPNYRHRGYATEILRQSLPVCSSLGIDRVLLTCDVENVGSQKVIERCGGIFENTIENPQTKGKERRYWIDIS
jgi:predicted acetyltransferase